MISLNGTNKLEAVMLTSPATTQPTFYASYAVADSGENFKTISNSSGSLTGATPATLVAAPGGSDLRHDARDITIFNVDTQANTITVRIDVSASKFKIWEGVVPAGGSVRLENGSGLWSVYGADGLKVEGSGSVAVALEVIDKVFNFDDASPIDFGSLVSGDEILNAELEITTVFDDVAATVTLGQTTDTGNILNSAQIDPTDVGTYHNAENFQITGADGVRIQIVPGTSTQGQGRAVVTIRRA